MMMKILVVYYSRGGVTRKIAQEITAKVQADLEEIVCTENMKGFLGFIRGGREASTGKLAAIAPIKADVTGYDLVVLGTPIWAGKLSSPAASFLNTYSGKVKKMAMFITRGNKSNDFISVIDVAGKKAGVSIDPKFSLDTGSVKGGKYDLGAFVKSLISL
jgi:flavodoxin